MGIFDDLDALVGGTLNRAKQIKICANLGLPQPNRVYKTWRPQKETAYTLSYVLDFIKRHDRVSVRQIYYGLVSQGYPNNIRAYRKIVNIVKRARLAGILPFDAVVDDTREAEKTPSWSSVESIMTAALHQYRSDWWQRQPYYVEVWLEKRALKRIFYPITNSYDVHLCVGGGYQSWSEIWEAKRRFERRHQPILILYFGDLDPSGKDMPRDIRERFELLGIPVTVKEIAISKEDVETYNLPPNPTKPGDTRNEWFIQKYGIDYAVELDALPPNVLKEKIKEAIESYANKDEITFCKYKDDWQRESWLERINNNGFENESEE